MADMFRIDRKKGSFGAPLPAPKGNPPVNIVLPVISPGTADVGTVISSTLGTWTSTTTISYSYKWQRNLTDIPGAVFSSYTVQNADLTQSITCLITAANTDGIATARSIAIVPSTVVPASGYDTSVGNGVDTAGFASLPLYAPGSDGSDLAAGAPTNDAGAAGSYNSGTRTMTFTATGPMMRWTGILTPGQSYHIVFNLTMTTFARPYIKDENGTVQLSPGYAGNGTSQTFLYDLRFTATGHDLIFDRFDDAFAGTIQMVKVAANTGGIGGRRFYVKPSTGSDTVNGTQAQSASTPMATVAAALKYCQSGRGDQILLAQGETFTRGLANIGQVGGFSAVYPFVVQSYDPANPTDETKMGRATGTTRPIITSSGADMTTGLCQCSTGVPSVPYYAVRGLKFNAAGASNSELKFQGSGTASTLDYILVENCEWAGTQLTFEGSSATNINHAIVRNSSFHGQYDSSVRGDMQGVYSATGQYLTIENSAFANCGWKEGANYTDSYTLGGASIYGHPVYTQDDTNNTIIRRCVFIQNANDGGRLKGGSNYYQNLVINTDICISAGGGNFYSSAAPNGVDMQLSYNAFIGGTTRAATASWGIWYSANCKNGSSAHHNLLARAPSNSYGIQVDAQQGDDGIALACYGNFYGNVIDAWANNDGQVVFNGGSTAAGDLGKIHATVNNNFWDDTASGTNLNISALTRPNRYTLSTLLSALNYTSLATAQADWLADPQNNYWLGGVPLLFAGYGVDTTSMPTITYNLHPVTYATLSPTDKAANLALSNGNLTVTSSSTGGAIRATRGVSSGKVYWEVQEQVFADAVTAAIADGIVTLAPGTTWTFAHSTSYATWYSTDLHFNSNGATVNAFSGWCGFALDATNKKLYIRDSSGWMTGMDPVAGTGGLDITGISTPIYPAFQGDSGDKATFNFGASAYQYTPPTGYGNI